MCTYLCINVYMYMNMYAYVCICTHVCVNVSMCADTVVSQCMSGSQRTSFRSHLAPSMCTASTFMLLAHVLYFEQIGESSRRSRVPLAGGYEPDLGCTWK